MVNKKFSLARRLEGLRAATDILSEDGEVLALQDDIITREMAEAIQNAGINSVDVFPIQKVGESVIQ